MILGYTLTTFPKSRKTLLHNQTNRNLWHNCKSNTKRRRKQQKQTSTELRAVAPCRTILNMATTTNPTFREIKQIATEAEAMAEVLSNLEDMVMVGPIIRVAMVLYQYQYYMHDPQTEQYGPPCS